LQLTNGADIKRSENFKVLIYAKPGAGKTSTVRYLQGKTLLLDIDDTSRVLSGYEGVDVAKINTDNPLQSIVDFYGYAKAHVNEYDNIVIDNLSHYQKLWFIEKGKNTKSGQPELQHYGLYDNHLLQMVSRFNELDVNVVYTAWETTRQIQLESGQIYNQFLPDVRDKIVNHIMGIIPIVARLMTNPETGNRGFILRESNGTFAKNQLDSREFALQEDIFKIGVENAD